MVDMSDPAEQGKYGDKDLPVDERGGEEPPHRTKIVGGSLDDDRFSER